MAGKCPMCGAPMDSDRCGYCGYAVPTVIPQTPLAPSDTTISQMENQPVMPNVVQVFSEPTITYGISRKSKTVALLLCIFLGYLGVHKFYVGKTGGGLLYLFTCGLFGIGWVVDILIIATGHFQDGFGLVIQN